MEGGNLASVHSSYSNRLLMQMFSDMNSENIGMWLGFQYNGRGGGFEWTDLSPFTYVNWAKDEPSGEYDGTGEILTLKGCLCQFVDQDFIL